MKTLKNLVDDKNSTKEDFIKLIKKLPYTIQDFDVDTTVVTAWGIEDVLQQAQDAGYNLTTKQAKTILDGILNCHDACIGINWDVIDTHIDDFVSENEIETNKNF